MNDIVFSDKLFSPLFWHLRPLLRDPAIRYIYIEGGSSAAKTFSICQALSLDMLEHNYSTIVFRRFGVDITDSIYSSFKAAQRSIQINPYWIWQQHLMKSALAENRIRFRGLDDEENIKGIEDFNVVYNNEWSQFTEEQFSQQRKRLRGKPNQKFICDWNPISSKLWHYDKWIDADTWTDLPLHVDAPTDYSNLNEDFAFKRINASGNAVWIKVTYRDNFWVVGHPSGKGGYHDNHTLDDFERDRIEKPNLYRVYANGERGVIRTGGEFWKQFDEIKHVKPVSYAAGFPIHVTIDNNVNPYVTVSLWQYIGLAIQQFHELPCRTPDNNAVKAANRLCDYLDRINYTDVLFMYGDPSANAKSTVDPNNSSFFAKFVETVTKRGYRVTNRIEKSAPQVALSAAFINEIYEHQLNGHSIVISDTCKVSVDDYATVKEDENGGMHKKKVKDSKDGPTYESHGHFSDAKRYFIISLLKAEFAAYKANKANRNSALYRTAQALS